MPAAPTPSRLVAVLLWAAAGSAAAQGGSAPIVPDANRGRLLYETHCIACHTTQMHWRDNRRVQDFAGLQAQVRGWQARTRLQWSDVDIQEVARHLNRTIYRLPEGEDKRGAAPAEGRRGGLS